MNIAHIHVHHEYCPTYKIYQNFGDMPAANVCFVALLEFERLWEGNRHRYYLKQMRLHNVCMGCCLPCAYARMYDVSLYLLLIGFSFGQDLQKEKTKREKEKEKIQYVAEKRRSFSFWSSSNDIPDFFVLKGITPPPGGPPASAPPTPGPPTEAAPWLLLESPRYLLPARQSKRRISGCWGGGVPIYPMSRSCRSYEAITVTPRLSIHARCRILSIPACVYVLVCSSLSLRHTAYCIDTTSILLLHTAATWEFTFRITIHI